MNFKWISLLTSNINPSDCSEAGLSWSPTLGILWFEIPQVTLEVDSHFTFTFTWASPLLWKKKDRGGIFKLWVMHGVTIGLLSEQNLWVLIADRFDFGWFFRSSSSVECTERKVLRMQRHQDPTQESASIWFVNFINSKKSASIWFCSLYSAHCLKDIGKTSFSSHNTWNFSLGNFLLQILSAPISALYWRSAWCVTLRGQIKNMVPELRKMIAKGVQPRAPGIKSQSGGKCMWPGRPVSGYA